MGSRGYIESAPSLPNQMSRGGLRQASRERATHPPASAETLSQQSDAEPSQRLHWIEAAPSSFEDLQHSISSLIENGPAGNWSVYLEDLERDELYSYRSDELLHPGSTIKLGIALDLLRWLDEHPEVSQESGPPNSSRNYAQLLYALLVWSEEDAAAILTEFLNSLPDHNLNEQLMLWGARDSSVTPREATARDLALLLARLERGELLSRANTAWMLSLLQEPSQGDEERLGGGLPSCLRTSLAHKTGTTFERDLGVVADVGLVHTADVHYVIAVIGNDVDWVDFEAGKETIAAISQQVFTTLQLFARPTSYQDEGCFLRMCPAVEDLLFCEDGLRLIP